jgi:integration host factor subunit alpha
MTLTKTKIGEAVAEQIGYPKNQSSDVVEILLEIIKRTLESNEEVLISGFREILCQGKA